MGEDNPRQEALLQFCVDLLVTSADALGVNEDEFAEWFVREGLDRQNHVFADNFSSACRRRMDLTELCLLAVRQHHCGEKIFDRKTGICS